MDSLKDESSNHHYLMSNFRAFHAWKTTDSKTSLVMCLSMRKWPMFPPSLLIDELSIMSHYKPDGVPHIRAAAIRRLSFTPDDMAGNEN